MKLACYLTDKNFKRAVTTKFKEKELSINFFDDKIIENLIESAEEVSSGKYFEHFTVSQYKAVQEQV